MMLRNQRLFVAVLSVGLSVGARYAASQEIQPTESAKSKSTMKTVDAPALPPIPLMVISRATWSIPEADKLGLTKVKREELSAFVTAHYQETSRLQRLQTDLDQTHLKSHRCQIAITELVDEANAKAQIKAQTFFTAEQLAKLRQAHRQEIQQASFATRQNPPQPNTISMPPLDTVLSNNDLLSILELPEIQQALAITDEQWQRIEAAKKEAYAAARQLVLNAAGTADVAAPKVDLGMQKLVEQLSKDTLQLLTEKQRTQYQELVQERHKRLSAPPANGEAFKDFKLILPHGTPTSSQTHVVGAESTIRLTLHNAFADPEVEQKLQLSESQQEEIAKKLAEFNPILAKHFQEQHRMNFQVETVRHQKLRELVLLHNAESHQQLADMLTTDQQGQLKKSCLKSLGWAALLKPEVVKQLQLTDEQTTFITAQFKKPAPAMPAFGLPGGSFEEFKKQSEDFHRKMTEHSTAMASAVWDKLTPDQREQFEGMTGLMPPRK